jgi:hypothetical protein
MKDVGLRIRVQRDLREQFLEACRAQDKPAAQVLREFMREYVFSRSAGRKHIKGNARSKRKMSNPVTRNILG